MFIIDQRVLGIAILFLLGMTVTIKRVTTGSILEKPHGSLFVHIVNIYNLFFLLIVNPLTAILLITYHLPKIDPTHITINKAWILIVVEMIGLAMYITGYLLMTWALIALGRNYQLGGSAPKPTDSLVVSGPYRYIRHPMYTSVLCISLGLALLVQSFIAFFVFCIHLGLILVLIPKEEMELQRAYPDQYLAYQKEVKTLVPFLY